MRCDYWLLLRSPDWAASDDWSASCDRRVSAFLDLHARAPASWTMIQQLGQDARALLGLPTGAGGLVETPLSRTLRPSAEDLRDEAWRLLKRRDSTSDPQVRKDLAMRAFELAQAAARLERDAGQ